jgi:hypothetical protein
MVLVPLLFCHIYRSYLLYMDKSLPATLVKHDEDHTERYLVQGTHHNNYYWTVRSATHFPPTSQAAPSRALESHHPLLRLARARPSPMAMPQYPNHPANPTNKPYIHPPPPASPSPHQLTSPRYFQRRAPTPPTAPHHSSPTPLPPLHARNMLCTARNTHPPPRPHILHVPPSSRAVQPFISRTQ